MKTIEINGEEYIRKADIQPADYEHVCVIATNGWIFEGMKVGEGEDGSIELANANVVRKWSNGLGIGGLADAEHKDDYTLDFIGSMRVTEVVAIIALRW